jgi:hypothetical protein
MQGSTDITAANGTPQVAPDYLRSTPDTRNGRANPHHNGHAPSFDAATYLPVAGAELTLNAWAIYDPEAAFEIGKRDITLNDPICRAIYNAHRAIFSTSEPHTPETIADLLLQQADATPFESERAVLRNAAAVVVKIGPPKGDARREIKRLLNELGTAESKPLFETYTFKDMALIPRLLWLIRGLLLEKITSLISADSGVYKSFIALEMGLCIALGIPFHGREVKQGTVVYVAAEGFFTIYDRARAWCQVHNCDLPENFHILKVPINLADEATVQVFAAHIEALEPVLVVLDTLSQNAVGLNENANEQMADFVRGMMSLGHRIGAHVQVLHHNAKASGAVRGAGAINANIDAHISLERPEADETNTVFVRCEKQRGKPFEAFALRGQEIELPYVDEYGDPVTSLVFEECGDAVTAKSEKNANSKRADKTREALLRVFDLAALEGAEYGGVKVGFWKEKVEESDPPICVERSFWRYRKSLEKDGTIEECGTHSGSPLYRRTDTTDTTDITDITVKVTTDSRRQNADTDVLTQLTPPFRGVSCVSTGGSGPEIEAALPEMPKRARRKSHKANSEPYQGTEVEI